VRTDNRHDTDRSTVTKTLYQPTEGSEKMRGTKILTLSNRNDCRQTRSGLKIQNRTLAILDLGAWGIFPNKQIIWPPGPIIIACRTVWISGKPSAVRHFSAEMFRLFFADNSGMFRL